MNLTSTTAATPLADLSQLLGVQVLAVTRNPPAHERPELAVVDGMWRRRPATDLDGRTQREWWWVTLLDPDPNAPDRPVTGRCLSLRFESREIRSGRALTQRLRRLGSEARLDGKTARRVLALMHEVIEEGTK